MEIVSGANVSPERTREALDMLWGVARAVGRVARWRDPLLSMRVAGVLWLAGDSAAVCSPSIARRAQEEAVYRSWRAVIAAKEWSAPWLIGADERRLLECVRRGRLPPARKAFRWHRIVAMEPFPGSISVAEATRRVAESRALLDAIVADVERGLLDGVSTSA